MQYHALSNSYHEWKGKNTWPSSPTPPKNFNPILRAILHYGLKKAASIVGSNANSILRLKAANDQQKAVDSGI